MAARKLRYSVVEVGITGKRETVATTGEVAIAAAIVGAYVSATAVAFASLPALAPKYEILDDTTGATL